MLLFWFWRDSPLLIPHWPLALVFFVFAILVVHSCQFLVEKAAEAIGPLERQAAFARAAKHIGGLVWALDAGGMLMYPERLPFDDAQLTPAILTLVLMIVTSYLTIPTLVTSRRPWRIALAALLLSLGMIFCNALLLTAFGEFRGGVRWSALADALTIATALGTILAIRHRSARFAQLSESHFHRFSWPEKCLSGVAIVWLHVCLINILPVDIDGVGSRSGELPLLLSLMLFGVLLIAYHVSALRVESALRTRLNQAVALVHSANAKAWKDNGARLSLIAENLDELLRSEHLKLHFQPLVPVDALRHGLRFEALLRLEDPRLGLIDPELFFLACERLERTTEADRLIIHNALRSSEPWLASGENISGISVNVSPRTLVDDTFMTWLINELRNYRLPRHWLKLEITEHAMMSDVSALATALKRLALLNIDVVMDDFGNGYSSLGIIADLPLEGIKFDRSFLCGLAQDTKRQALLRTLCALARELALSTTVEGVENAQELRLVESYEPSYVQGYVHARPMPADRILPWLHTRLPSRALDTAS